MTKILIISDLHLSEHRPKATALFKKFISSHASKVDQLYILGDFFDYWIGDDHRHPFHDYIAGLLRTLTSANTKVFLMVGNRDFLLGEQFAKSCGAKLLADPYILRCKGTRYLLMHGDSLCTQEILYSAYRKLVRTEFFKNLFLALPIFIREFLALRLRKHSYKRQYGKKWIDVSKKAVEQILQHYGLQHLIHGHTHEFKTHHIPHKHKKESRFFIKLSSSKIYPQTEHLHPSTPKERIVLGDWSDENGSFVFINTEGHAKLHLFKAHS